jgi:hypothetical protein
MRENHDWVDNKLERRYGTTQYNLAIQDYMNTMEPFDIFDNVNNDNDYVTYTTPFFGEAYYNCDLDNEFEIEEEDNRMDVDEEYEEEFELEPRNLMTEFDEVEIEQGMYINYDDNVYIGSYKYF